jgi:hypothetical protein
VVLLPKSIFSELWVLAVHHELDAPLFRSPKSGADGMRQAIIVRLVERFVKAAARRASIREGGIPILAQARPRFTRDG